MANTKQTSDGANPFRPGPGETPPLLAGRGHEQDVLGTRIRDLAAGGSRRFFSIYGPRGVGKTALLGWVAEECQRLTDSGERQLSVIQAKAPIALASEDALLTTLAPEMQAAGQTEMGVRGGVPKVAEASLKMTSTFKGVSLADLDRALIAACQKTPMVVVLDEAHVVENALLYRQFLNLAQAVAEQAPFLLALAGTPDLPEALNSLKATFISRAQALGIGLLKRAGAEEAIRVPLERHQIHIADDALAFAVAEAQRYPYFLQSWGRSLWNAAKASGAQRLTLQDAEAARDEPQGEKRDYYAERYAEVAENQLTKAAAWAVAEAFQGADWLEEEQVHRVVQEALSPYLPKADLYGGANEQISALRRLGFVWRMPNEDIVRPGIPSLMDYTRDRCQRAQ